MPSRRTRIQHYCSRLIFLIVLDVSNDFTWCMDPRMTGDPHDVTTEMTVYKRPDSLITICMLVMFLHLSFFFLLLPTLHFSFYLFSHFFFYHLNVDGTDIAPMKI